MLELTWLQQSHSSLLYGKFLSSRISESGKVPSMVTIADISDLAALYLENRIDYPVFAGQFMLLGTPVAETGTPEARKLYSLLDEIFRDVYADHLPLTSFRTALGLLTRLSS